MCEHGMCASCRWWTPWDERGYYADYGTCYLRPPAVTGNERRGNRDLAPTVSARPTCAKRSRCGEYDERGVE
jgi:hypothetical protein